MSENSRFFDNVAAMVATGSTVKTAAAECGCSESHAYTLSAQPEFKRRVAELRSAITFQAVGKLSAASSQAVDVLVELLGTDHEPKDRLAAAKSILSLLAPISELSELRSRIDALESSHKMKAA